MSNIRITTLVENTASSRGTLGEHGLAFWIETGAHHVLFDTGQTPEVLAHNARRLGVDLGKADAVVLSHGHFDHTGGLDAVLGRADQPRLLLHPAALDRRFSRHEDGSVHDVGIPPHQTAERLARVGRVEWTEAPTEIVPGLLATGAVPRRTDYEDTGGAFYLDEACARPDPITDDQALFFESDRGTVVILGCAHAGVINTLMHVRHITGERPVHAVIGGMHLVHASAERMDRTVEALGEWSVGLLAPMHCTGPAATARLGSAFTERWRPAPVGAVFEFESRRAGS
jgi:7,8-dihydropterin-6-yl-methyl-4-(beta-D-ribofuranosyl)aminobenzene 5'-phosphate synthase